MGEEELGRLLVRLLGDSSDFKAMMGDAKKDMKEAEKNVAEVGKGVKTLEERLGSMAGIAATAFGAFKAKEFLQESLDAYKEQAKADRQLTQILKLNGRAVKDLNADYQEFASTLQDTIPIADESVVAMLKQAELMGLTGEKAKQAVKNSIALAAAHGGEADSYMRMTIAMENGRMGRIGMLLGMGEMEEGADKLAVAQEKLNRMWEFAQEDAKSLGNQSKILGNQYNNLQEDFGKVISEAIAPFRKQMMETKKELIQWASGWSSETKAIATGALALTAALAGLTAAVGTFVAFKGTIIATGAAMRAFAVGFATSPITLWVAAIAGAVVVLKQLSDRFTGAKESAKELEATLGRIKTRTTEIGGKETSAIEQMMGLEDVDKKKAELERAFHEISALIERRLKAVDATAAAASNRDVGIRHVPILGEAFDQDFKEAESKLRMQQDLLKTALENRESIRRALAGIDKDRAREAGKAGIGAIGAIADGMAGAAEQALDLQKSVDSLNRSMQIQIGTFGMTSEEAELYKLRLEGATEEQLVAAKASAAWLKQLGEQKALMEQGKEVAKEFMTPQEKFAERMADLDRMLKGGAISQDVFQRATESAQKQLEDATRATSDMTMEVQRLDAALSGGADAKERIANFRAMLETQEESRLKRNPAPVANGAVAEKAAVSVLEQIRDLLKDRDVIEVEVEDLE